MQELYDSIDRLIIQIKVKGDKEEFTFEDSKLILCLEIVRLELSQNKELSDNSFGAISVLSSWSYHYYKDNYVEIHQQLLNVHKELTKLNTNEYKGDIKSPINNRKEDWYRYFGEAIKNLMENR